ncbi:hypothetical protein SA2016_3675 [Sinomonas atrocyanea]|uniref:Uncharacterized protein n=1 Tax=Sinomonas atrocyanea TaxID=37927 RepID=A0A127A4T3_9MICC|nr:hypothetical protein SA2016_3675 [Sinomonas atrocyanea]
MSRRLSRSMSPSRRALATVTATPGWRARKARTTSGMSEAPTVGNVPSRSWPRRRPANSPISACAASIVLSISSA